VPLSGSEVRSWRK